MFELSYLFRYCPYIFARPALQVGKMQRLNRLVVTEELPRSPIGKVLKRELRDRL